MFLVWNKRSDNFDLCELDQCRAEMRSVRFGGPSDPYDVEDLVVGDQQSVLCGLKFGRFVPDGWLREHLGLFQLDRLE